MDKIRCPINQLAEHLPHEPALFAHDRTCTWRHYDSLVASVSAHLAANGIGGGTCVALCGPNSLEMIVSLMAIFRLGAVACPISPRLPDEGLRRALRQCGAEVYLKLSPSPELSQIRTIGLPDIGVLRPVDGDVPQVNLDHPATIIFTSGSSDTPKSALLSYGNHYYNALGSNENIAFGTGDRWLLSLPLYHVGGMAILFRSIVSGGAVVIPENTNDLVDVASRSHVTHLSLVSTQFIRFVEALSGGRDLRLKAVLLGGSAMPGFLVRAGHALGLPIFTSYGMTEMASQIATSRPGETLERIFASGKPLPYREVEIASDGEILVRGKTRFLGYTDGSTIETPFNSDGWFHTGDLGSIDDDGYLHVNGRKDNMFISGGENIQPEEIERLLTQLEFVMEAVVVAVPDDEFGMRPVAFVRTLDGRPVDERYVVMYLERFLPRFKIPDSFYTWPEESSGLKINRRSLAALVQHGTT